MDYERAQAALTKIVPSQFELVAQLRSPFELEVASSLEHVRSSRLTSRVRFFPPGLVARLAFWAALQFLAVRPHRS